MKRLAVLFTLLLLGVVPPAFSQQASWPPDAPIKRTPLQRFDVPATNYETIIGMAEIAPT
jgi:hypothetical protein